MKRPLRIAILLCDSPLYLTAEKYGSYGGSLKNEIPGIENGMELTSWNVYQVEEYPNLEDIDAILMTGSRFSSYDDLPWIKKLVDFTKTILAQDRVRIIGVCFGHQILGRALGLPVCRNEIAWETSVTPMSLTPTGQCLFKANLKPSMLSLMQMHRDMVRVEGSELPDGIENLGSTDGHPEFTPDIVKEIIHTRTEMGIFTKEMHDDAMNRIWDGHDGITVGCAFLRFLIE
ncbi:class I glutamine amidotransferase-like protein [Terfezia claveryi]|nr:class I glutamine amidotransferase-like protein [Terfezia claveryi]